MATPRDEVDRVVVDYVTRVGVAAFQDLRNLVCQWNEDPDTEAAAGRVRSLVDRGLIVEDGDQIRLP